MRAIPLLDPMPLPDDLGRADHRFWSEEAESGVREQLGPGLCPLSDADYACRVGDLLDAARARAPLHTLVSLAAAVGVVWPPTRDGAAPAVLEPPVPSDADLVRMCTDLAPDLPDTLPEVLLGDTTWHLDAADAADRRLLLACLATAAFHTPHGYDRSPARFWLRTRPTPSDVSRARVAAVDAAPHLPWRARPIRSGMIRLTPMLPIAPWFLPVDPLPADAVSWVGARPDVEAVVFARAVRHAAGWSLRCALGWPVTVAAAPVEHAAFTLALPHLLANRALRDVDVWRAVGPPLQAQLTAELLSPGAGGAA